jgi:hypothetical protein
MPSDMETTEEGTIDIHKVVHHNSEVVDMKDTPMINPTETEEAMTKKPEGDTQIKTEEEEIKINSKTIRLQPHHKEEDIMEAGDLPL